MWACENQSDVEAELKSKEPTEMGGDASTSEDDKDWGVVVTLLEHHEPAAMFVSGGQDVERHGDVPMSRKHATSSDNAVEREAKQARSPERS